jgi:hypothetical protein
MSLSSDYNKRNRRTFLANTVKLALLGGLLSPLEACNNKSKTEKLPGGNLKTKGGSVRVTKKQARKKWSHESLVINEKTKVIHFPTSKLYHYYDPIKTAHLKEIGIASWAIHLQEPVRLNKEQSGNILELLCMQDLHKGINEQSLAAGIQTLSKAFGRECENVKGVNSNTTNFRLHELMLVLVSLNRSIPQEGKWDAFNEKIKRPASLRKRQKWMESRTAFEERVRYITDREQDYIARLSKRAAKYSFN